MMAVCSSKRSVNVYQTILHHFPEYTYKCCSPMNDEFLKVRKEAVMALMILSLQFSRRIDENHEKTNSV
jgi:hypothetical protein